MFKLNFIKYDRSYTILSLCCCFAAADTVFYFPPHSSQLPLPLYTSNGSENKFFNISFNWIGNRFAKKCVGVLGVVPSHIFRYIFLRNVHICFCGKLCMSINQMEQPNWINSLLIFIAFFLGLVCVQTFHSHFSIVFIENESCFCIGFSVIIHVFIVVVALLAFGVIAAPTKKTTTK